jgi:hypothetical protein
MAQLLDVDCPDAEKGGVSGEQFEIAKNRFVA